MSMSREQIVRDTAYAIWEAEGRPDGRDGEHWRLAEERVAASLKEPAPKGGIPKSKAPVKGKVEAGAAKTAPKVAVPKAVAPLKAAATKAAPKKR
jgi:hypothetical protein